MRRADLWKFGTIIGLILVSITTVLPTFLGVDPADPEQPWYIRALPEKAIKLGLDLKGGIHLVLGIDVEKAIENEAERYATDLRELLPDEGVPVASVRKVMDSDRIEITLRSLSQKDGLYRTLRQKFDVLEVESENDETMTYSFAIVKQRQTQLERDTIEQTLETIRNRIDQFGVNEPEIAAQGRNRIIVQLPDLDDPDRAKEVLGKTAQLEFKLVDESRQTTDLYKIIESAKNSIEAKAAAEGEPSLAAINEYLRQEGTIPDGSEVLYGSDGETGDGDAGVPYLVESKVLLTGEVLEDARVMFGGQFNEPQVSLRFSPRGSAIFADVTKAHQKRRLAIVLDNKVNSAPVINEPILNGRASISFNSMQDRQQILEEARSLTIVLRAGALPAPVEILENRAVGPTLGLDSIRMGTKSLTIGGLMVIFFMLLIYRRAGIVADLVLITNMLFILAMLAGFSATLTLPGIAGIVLTIGMAVDANIIVYERIREELGLGKSPDLAIQTGFERAHLTVLDANVTTLIAGVVLLQYGSGPVRGFAVTLIIGVLSSYITAIWFARFLFGWMLRNESLSAKLFAAKEAA